MRRPFASQGLLRMNRQDKHQMARSGIAARLRRMGLEVEEVTRNGKYDLLVNRACARRLARCLSRQVCAYGHRQRPALRIRLPQLELQLSPTRALGAQVLRCLRMRRQAPPRGGRECSSFRRAAVTGPTFSLHGAGKPYRGRYAAYRNRWSVFFKQPQELTAPRTRLRSALAAGCFDHPARAAHRRREPTHSVPEIREL